MSPPKGTIMEAGLVILALIIFLVLMFQRWFWLIALGIGSLASCVAMLVSIIHLNFASALGYVIAMVVLWFVAKEIADNYPSLGEKREQENHHKHNKNNPDWSPH